MAATATERGHTVTNVGPLPASFTLSASCTNEKAVFNDGSGSGVYVWYVGQECDFDKANLVVKDGCLPSKYNSAYGADASVYPVFSPATACPEGYGPSCTWVGAMETFASSITVLDALSIGQTAIGCCPT